jgi:drug/metabolite transporter (DMT)-like permease
MSPGLWGAIAAVAWGTCDFLARFTGRAAGFVNALLGMLLVSSVFLTLWVALDEASLVWTKSSLFLLVFAGVSSLIGYLFLYWAFARGPVSLAAPIAGSYPAMVVLIAVVLGSRPSALQWMGTALTLVGVVVVARGGAATAPDSVTDDGPRDSGSTRIDQGIGPGDAARRSPEPDSRAGRLLTVAGASVAALAWAFMISATQEVAPVVGSLQTIWLPRVVAFVLLAAFVSAAWVRGRPRPSIPGRWWPVIAAQAGLDVGGYYALYTATAGPNPEIAAMASSAYYVVTVLLGRAVLKERILPMQAAGVVLVFAGVVLLSS